MNGLITKPGNGYRQPTFASYSDFLTSLCSFNKLFIIYLSWDNGKLLFLQAAALLFPPRYGPIGIISTKLGLTYISFTKWINIYV